MVWKVSCGTVVVLLLITAFGLFRNKAEAQKPSPGGAPDSTDKGMGIYLGLRKQVLSGSSAQMGQSPTLGPNEPWAVLMDMSIPHRTATIAAFADGTASIYISNGGGYLGGGQKYPSVRDAGQKMIAVARRFQSTMQITKQFPLPEQGEIIFYVVTDRGVYTARVPEAECRKRTHPLTELYAAGQEVITQYRLNTPKP